MINIYIKLIINIDCYLITCYHNILSYPYVTMTRDTEYYENKFNGITSDHCDDEFSLDSSGSRLI